MEGISGDFSGARNLRSDQNGNLYFSKDGAFYKYDSAKSATKTGDGVLWGFYCDGESKIVEHPANTLSLVAKDGAKSPLSNGLRIRSIAVTHSGNIYAATLSPHDANPV